MLLKISPALKGLITALAMIAAALVIDQKREAADPRIQYFVFIIYGLGIAWTLIAFSKTAQFTGSFRQLFSQGFRCFIVVTLCMVVFTFIFIKAHPEFAEIEATHQREELLKLNDKTPAQVDELIATGKKQYAIRYISASIFGYLIIGAAITATASILLTRRKD